MRPSQPASSRRRAAGQVGPAWPRQQRREHLLREAAGRVHLHGGEVGHGQACRSPSNCRTRRARQSPNQSRPMNTGKSGGATRSLVLTMWPLAGLTTCGKASPLAQPTQSCAPSPPGCGQSPSPARRTGMRPVVNWPMPARSATSRFCTGDVIAPPHGPPPPRRPPGSAPAARSPRRPRATGWPSPPRTRCRGRRVAGQVADHRAMPGLAHRDLLVRRRRGRRCAPRAW